jgi:putative acetyltransferase
MKKQLIGHILFSRVRIDNPDDSLAPVAVAPIAVLPANQRHGVGGMLIRSGYNSLRDRGECIVVVLGHPEYYPRFGFSVERARGLVSPLPPDALMAV